MSRNPAAAPAPAPEAERAARLNRIARLLATGGLVLLILGVAVVANGSADTWWHLATGRWIAQHHAVPHADPFSYTAAGKTLVAHEYLSDLLMYLVFQLGGWPGLLMLSGTVLTLGWWLVYRRCTGPVVVNGAAVLLGLVSARPVVTLRPQMFSFLLGAVFLWILDRYQRDRKWKLLLWLPVLMLLWVQLHGGYVLGLAIVGVVLAGAAADLVFSAKREDVLGREQALPLLWTLLGCTAVVALNPNGLAAYTHPFAIMSMRVNRQIVEWQPPRIDMPMFYPFFALLALTLITMMAAHKRYRAGQWLLFLAFAFATLRSARNMAVFPLVAVPLLAQGIRFPEAARAWGNRLTPAVRAGLAALLLIAGAWWASQETKLAADMQVRANLLGAPAAAVKFMQSAQLAQPIFNAYQFGGYLTWAAPEYKVFIDGRSDLYGDDFVENYAQVYNGNVAPDPMLNAWGVRTVLVPSRSAMAGELRSEPGTWRVAYEDSFAVIFTR